MVAQVTSLSRNGVSDWVIQRVSAMVLALYTLCVVGFVVISPDLTYTQWSMFMESRGMQIFTMLALISTCAHAWIGMWTVGSDYLQEHTLGEKASSLRFIFQIGCVLVIVAYLLWGIDIIWGS